MEEIKSVVASPTFWISSVVLAFLMSFFASYAKDWVDSWFVHQTEKKDAEARLRQKNFQARVLKLKENPYLLGLYQTNIVYQKLRQVLYLVVCYVCMVLSLYSFLNFNTVSALGVLIFGLFIFLLQQQIVSKRLNELRSVVNAALGDDEVHFIG